MAEEGRCQEGHRLCANNCGFFGSPAMLDLCSKCYRDYRLKEEQAASAKIAVEKSLASSSSSSSSSPSAVAIAVAVTSQAEEARSPVSLTSPEAPTSPVASQTSRCMACRKRVGLTGFKCRCGATYCGTHRYPEQHRCTFDFKAAGREAIARANPVVKTRKLDNQI